MISFENHSYINLIVHFVNLTFEEVYIYVRIDALTIIFKSNFNKRVLN